MKSLFIVSCILIVINCKSQSVSNIYQKNETIQFNKYKDNKSGNYGVSVVVLWSEKNFGRTNGFSDKIYSSVDSSIVKLFFYQPAKLDSIVTFDIKMGLENVQIRSYPPSCFITSSDSSFLKYLSSKFNIAYDKHDKDFLSFSANSQSEFFDRLNPFLRKFNNRLITNYLINRNDSISKDFKIMAERLKQSDKNYDRLKKVKNIWLYSALLCGTIGAISSLQANSTYEKYKTTSGIEANDLIKWANRFKAVSPVAFGCAGLSVVVSIFKPVKQKKAKSLSNGKSLNFYPVPIKNGAGVGLAYQF